MTRIHSRCAYLVRMTGAAPRCRVSHPASMDSNTAKVGVWAYSESHGVGNGKILPANSTTNTFPVFSLAVVLIMFASGVLSAGESGIGPAILSLDECISMAMKNYPQLAVTDRRLRQKREMLRAYTAEALPRIDAMASYDRLSYVTQAKQRFLGGSNDDYRAGFIVTQPLFAGGRITAKRRSARYAVEAAEQGYRAAGREVVFRVKSAYYRLLFALDILKSRAELIEYAEASHATALELNKRARIPREETLLRLEVQLDDFRQKLIVARDDLTIARKVLLNEIGLDSATMIEIRDLEDGCSPDEKDPADISGNPEILKISREISGASETVNMAWGVLYPQARVYYSHMHEWARLPTGNADWVAGVAVDFNVWAWGKTLAEVRQVRAYKDELMAQRDRLIRQIDLDMGVACLKYNSACRRIGLARTSLDHARRSLEIYRSRYRNALVTSFELLDAQEAFSQAQANFALAVLEMRLTGAEIRRLAGAGA